MLFGIMLLSFLARLELFLQRGELGEGRVRVGLPAAFFRIDPLARLAAIAILEVAPAFAARTIVSAVIAVAIRPLTAAAFALQRTAFPLRPITAFRTCAAS